MREGRERGGKRKAKKGKERRDRDRETETERDRENCSRCLQFWSLVLWNIIEHFQTLQSGNVSSCCEHRFIPVHVE